MDEASKPCTKCGLEKQLSSFAKRAAKLDGRRSQCRACDAAERAAKVDYERERVARWRAEHPKRQRAAGRRQAEQLRRRLSMFAGCWMCGGEWSEVDHVKPLAKGGPHILANLRPICRSCNASKADAWPYPTTRKAA